MIKRIEEMEVINAKDFVKESEDKMKTIYKYITQAYRKEYADKIEGFPISSVPILNLNIPDIEWDKIIHVNHINKSEDLYTKTFINILKNSPLRYLKIDKNSKSLCASMYSFSIDMYNQIKVDTNVDNVYNILESGQRTKNYWNEMLNYFFTKNQILYYKLFSIDLSYIEAINDSINSFLTMDSYLDKYVQEFFSNYFKMNSFSNCLEYIPGPVKLKPRCLVKLKEYYDEELEYLNSLYKEGYLNYYQSQINHKNKMKIDYSNTLFKVKTPIIMHLKDKLRGSVTLFPEMRQNYIMDKLHHDLLSINYIREWKIGDDKINIKFWYCKNSFSNSTHNKNTIKNENIIYKIMTNILSNKYTILYTIYIFMYTIFMTIDLINNNNNYIFLWSVSFLDWIYYYFLIKMAWILYEYINRRNIVNIDPFENNYKDIKYYYLIKRFKMFSIFELQLIDQEYVYYKKKVHKHYSNIRDINFVNEEEDIL